jgi:transposase
MPWKVVLKPQTFENTEDGYQVLLEWFAQYQLSAAETVVCMEATGVYSEGLAYFLYAKGYRVALQSPLEVKRTFKPYGPKSDAVDSLQIAEYACRHTDKLAFWKPRSEVLEQVKALLTVREQFVAQNTAHKNALQAIQRKVVRTPFAEQAYLQLIEQVKKQIKAIDLEIRRLIESDPTFKEMLLLLLSVPGVGLLLAAHLSCWRNSLWNTRAWPPFLEFVLTSIPAAPLSSDMRLLDTSDHRPFASYSTWRLARFVIIANLSVPTWLAKPSRANRLDLF